MTGVRTGQYRHIKSGTEYGCLGECKVKINGDWVNGVVYLKHGNIFVRELAEFEQKFERIGDTCA